jgi:hypothetical protein
MLHLMARAGGVMGLTLALLLAGSPSVAATSSGEGPAKKKKRPAFSADNLGPGNLMGANASGKPTVPAALLHTVHDLARAIRQTEALLPKARRLDHHHHGLGRAWTDLVLALENLLPASTPRHSRGAPSAGGGLGGLLGAGGGGAGGMPANRSGATPAGGGAGRALQRDLVKAIDLLTMDILEAHRHHRKPPRLSRALHDLMMALIDLEHLRHHKKRSPGGSGGSGSGGSAAPSAGGQLGSMAGRSPGTRPFLPRGPLDRLARMLRRDDRLADRLLHMIARLDHDRGPGHHMGRNPGHGSGKAGSGKSGTGSPGTTTVAKTTRETKAAKTTKEAKKTPARNAVKAAPARSKPTKGSGAGTGAKSTPAKKGGGAAGKGKSGGTGHPGVARHASRARPAARPSGHRSSGGKGGGKKR